MRTTAALFGIACLWIMGAGAFATAGEIQWKQHDINRQSINEAAAAIDVDRDGDLDVVCGDTWYEAPAWTAHHLRDVPRYGTYTGCFASLPLDMDGDGDHDFVTVSYFGKSVAWVENPGSKDATWPVHPIDEPGPSECAVLEDLTGDGQPEILPNTVNVVVFYALQSNDGKPTLKKYDFGTEAAGHGVGSGDVNADGRTDLLTPKGWFEAPANPAEDTWTWHPEWTLDGGEALKDLRPGIQILARDVDGDGLSDVVYAMGHNRGLFWIKQEKGPEGNRVWGQHRLIDNQPTSVHTLLWVDIDGDGQAHELVTGKRVYAHEKEEGDTEAPIIAWYAFDQTKGDWVRHLIYQGEPATNAPAEIPLRDAQKDFPPGTCGVGLQIDAVDLDRDGDVDLVFPGKSGLYWFENLGAGRSE